MTADELRERRVELGMSQKELADALGLRANTVARWERGEKVIGHGVMLALAMRALREGQR
jgi:transcriptional regulator with XRE-family HTH domain